MPSKGRIPTHVFNASRPQHLYPGEMPTEDAMTAPRMWTSSSEAPDGDNDALDTAGLGQDFLVGDFWNYNSTLYWCTDNTAGSAVWKTVDLTGL